MNVNSILALFGNAYTQVKYRLFKSYCMALYGCVLWVFSSPGFTRFCTTWRKSIRRLFQLSYMTHSKYLPLICQDIPFRLQLFRRFNRFMFNSLNSDNPNVKLCSHQVLHGSMSNVGKNVNTICQE